MVENQTKKIIVIVLVFIFLTLVFLNGIPAEQRLNINGGWKYKLNYGDVEKEVKRQFIGESPIPWDDSFSGKQFISQVFTVRDGFRLPEMFFYHWPSALTQGLVNYWNFTAESGSDFGWVYYHSDD